MSRKRFFWVGLGIVSVLALAGAAAQADVIWLTQTRSVNAEAYNFHGGPMQGLFGVDDNQSDTAPDWGAYDRTLNASAPPTAGWTSTITASARLSTSAPSASGLSIYTSVGRSTPNQYWGQYDRYGATATATMDMTFRLTSPVHYDLAERFALVSEFYLSGPSGTVADVNNPPPPPPPNDPYFGWGNHWSGTLTAGDYHFRLVHPTSTYTDSDWEQVTLTFSAATPEPASLAGVMLLGGLLLRRRR